MENEFILTSTEFAKLVGADDHMGWNAKGPDYSRPARFL